MRTLSVDSYYPQGEFLLPPRGVLTTPKGNSAPITGHYCSYIWRKSALYLSISLERAGALARARSLTVVLPGHCHAAHALQARKVVHFFSVAPAVHANARCPGR